MNIGSRRLTPSFSNSSFCQSLMWMTFLLIELSVKRTASRKSIHCTACTSGPGLPNSHCDVAAAGVEFWRKASRLVLRKCTRTRTHTHAHARTRTHARTHAHAHARIFVLRTAASMHCVPAHTECLEQRGKERVEAMRTTHVLIVSFSSRSISQNAPLATA